MLPIATIVNITHPEIDTVVIWHDGQRAIAYAYHNGRVVRTTPLAAGGPAEQAGETRGQFHITDGTVHPLGTQAAPLPPPISLQPIGVTPGPSRWG